VRAVARSGNYPALHTNGIRLADREYVRRLVDAGMTEVHLQFDGFREETYRAIRGQEMMEIKRKALANLEEFNVATDLVVTVLRNDNEAEMRKVLDYAVAHDFVREVFYLGCRSLGSATGKFDEQCLVPDEVLDSFLEQMEGRITRRHLFIFQKLYFTFLHLFRVRKCLYIHHYLMVREGDGAVPINEIIDLEKVDRALDRYAATFERHPLLARARLLTALGRVFLTPRGLRFIGNSLKIQFLLLMGFDLSRIPSRTILLGWITACDPMIFDSQVARNCGKGEISMDLGCHDSGAWANVLRERLVQAKDGDG